MDDAFDDFGIRGSCSFGHGGTGDEDAQPLPAGFPPLQGGLGTNNHDVGTRFSDEEDEDHLSRKQEHDPRRNSSFQAIERGKHLRHQQTLHSRDQNLDVMPKTTKGVAKNGKGNTTRSATVGDGMKEELEKKNEENLELKRKSAALEKEKKDQNKKVRAKKHEVRPVAHTKGTWHEIEVGFRQKVWPHHKFMSHEADEQLVMELALKETTEWKPLKDLSDDDLHDQASECRKAHGQSLCTAMNKARSEDQTAVRKQCLKDVKEGNVVSSMQHPSLLNRPEGKLLLQAEDAGDQEADQANKEVNKKNEKCRSRLVHLLMNCIRLLSPSKTWTPDLQSTKCLSNCKDTDGKDMMPPEVEAALILFIENNEDEWMWQASILKDHKTIEAWKKQATPDETKEQPEPPTKHSSSSCGASECGGWSEEGKKRFRTLVKLVKKGRAKDTTPGVEEPICDLIKKEHRDNTRANRRAKPDALEAVMDEEDENEEVDFEEYDSDLETANLKQKRFISKKEKDALAKAKAAEEEKAKALAAKSGETTADEEEEDDEEIVHPAPAAATTTSKNATTATSKKGATAGGTLRQRPNGGGDK